MTLILVFPLLFAIIHAQNDSNTFTTRFFVDPDDLHMVQRIKLEENESIRAEIYQKYLPFFVLSGVTFVILSFVWIIFNFLSYRRKQKKIKKFERLGRRLESQRLLQLYHEVPNVPVRVDL
uniref:Uncharacterized protein n=1 Tax=Panagrolaimus sp. JU765 TaxID=591449 RepID=A0AC34QYP2_9BILA